MKNVKQSTALLVLALGFGLTIMLSAFNSHTVSYQYQYLSESKAAEEIKNINNWMLVDKNTPNCGTEGSLVCRYEFDGDINQFKLFLAHPSTTAEIINQDAISTKL